MLVSIVVGIVLAGSILAPAQRLTAAEVSTPALTFRIAPENGSYQLIDKSVGVTWRSLPGRFGEATLNLGGKQQRIALGRCEVKNIDARHLTATFHPLTNETEAIVEVTVAVQPDDRTLEFSYSNGSWPNIESVRLLDQALGTTDAARGYAVVPVREGLLVPADSGLTFTQRFDTYAYEGCHMAMFGIVNDGAAALVTWDDPNAALELRSVVLDSKGKDQSLVGATVTKQLLAPTLTLRKSAKSFRVRLLGPGDYVTIAKAYRDIARQRGWLVTWDEKLKQNPERAKYLGASNYKLWSTLSRRMNNESTQEESVRVNWTFDEAAQVAEHLKRDLQLDKVLFTMGGWIHRGYDNQHPDILPTAPECGGDAAFVDACRRIRALGYLLCLHDNYQDIYRDSPSWDERLIQKNADGSLTKGGQWAGGRAYITCSKMAVDLAQRPQNLRAIKKLSDAASYFIDTTYAAGLQECFDKEHPLTRTDDMKWKQALSDYARDVFGSFGSECGREWAIPHADFFEGLTGVSGKYYHTLDPAKLGASVIPLFELVYRDCIAMYGKYGYEPMQAAEYVLHHIALGRPLNYHSIPAHLYWKDKSRTVEPLDLQPSVAEFKQTGPRQFSIAYQWRVADPTTEDWRVFVHFTDPGSGGADKIRFQNDHAPKTATSEWKAGAVREGPFTIQVPDGLSGTFAVRMGLYRTPGGERALLAGSDGERRSLVVGTLQVAGAKIEFEPILNAPKAPNASRGLFTRADHGWADGMHVLDRFVKNTHEILSPLNEITSRLPMTKHQFLTADRKVQRSVFGSGAEAIDVIVNASPNEFRHQSKAGGNVTLPQYGFIVESATFIAFCATEWNAEHYETPTLFTLRSNGQPLTESKRVAVFHGFGSTALRLGNNIHHIEREAILTP